MKESANRPRAWRGAWGMLLWAAAGLAGAAPFDLDPGYGTQGRVTFGTGQPDGQIGRSVVQADGKLVVTGSRPTQVDNQPGAELFARRFNADGSVDAGFGTNGESRFSVRGRDAINMITLDANGRIVLAVSAQEPCTNIPFGGCFNSAGQVAPLVSAVVRLRTDGALDATLAGKGYTEATDFYGGYAVAVQPDGKLLLLGTTGVARARIFNWNLARFNSDGTRDPGFNGGQSVASRCDAFGFAVLVQPDGGIVVGGDDSVFYADSAVNSGFCIERLFPDGSHDTAFNQGQLRTNFGINVSLLSMAVLPGGKLLAVGRGIQTHDTLPLASYDSGFIAARYFANGMPDSSYGNGGKWFVPVADYHGYVDFTFARDGGFVAAGYEYPVPPAGSAQQYRPTLLKVTADGQPDATFGAGGIARGPFGPDRPVGFLRDIEDRWYLISATTLPDLTAGALIERYKGERPESVPVIEFYNVNLQHYFITASAAEAAGIDAGAAGPGWQRTGGDFRAWQPVAAGTLNGVPQLARTLCRFYGTPGQGPNSHFYTIDVPECDFVRRDPGWTFENYAFYAYPPLATPTGNACPGGLAPVYRVYNNRYAQNDSNHRYTTSAATYQQMQQQGWAGEGVVFCAAP
ncbi:MAG: hypothetical protein IPO58_26415 [Betaproteobacteria bacterium]|nr:hypothetical protein [Betaproteobacteria bacterium]